MREHNTLNYPTGSKAVKLCLDLVVSLFARWQSFMARKGVSWRAEEGVDYRTRLRQLPRDLEEGNELILKRKLMSFIKCNEPIFASDDRKPV